MKLITKKRFDEIKRKCLGFCIDCNEFELEPSKGTICEKCSLPLLDWQIVMQSGLVEVVSATNSKLKQTKQKEKLK